MQGADLAVLQDLSYWQQLVPDLTITEGRLPEITAIAFDSNRLDRISERLHHDGYIYEPPTVDPVLIARLRAGMRQIVAAGWPAAFIYVYDEPWQVFRSLGSMLGHFLGDDFALLPHFWAWHIDPDPNGETAGWPAHVDYPGECAFFDDYLVSLSLWVPLTHATPENGCMNILPLSRQKRYDPPVSEPSHIKVEDVRCLPAQAGSVLGWRQDLWHWSGRSSRYAQDPRMALSLEFQNRAFDPLCPPLFDIAEPPVPADRIRYICGQFAKYDHMETVAPALYALGKQIGMAHP